MQNNFIKNESYLHEYAKGLLANTLKKVETEAEDSCKFNCLSWRKNYGVFTELPFHVSDDPYYFELSAGIKSNVVFEENNYLEMFAKDFDRGRILFVPDICIFHKGTPKFFLEVVHKNSVAEWKKERIKSFFDGFYIEAYEVSALEILSQVNDISNITFTKIL